MYRLGHFYKILPHVDIIYAQMQNIQNDPVKLNKNLADFHSTICSIRANVQSTEITERSDSKEPQVKKRRHQI